MLNGRNGHAVSSIIRFCSVPLPSDTVLIHKKESEYETNDVIISLLRPTDNRNGRLDLRHSPF